MAELVDARGLGPRGESRGGSSPFARTICVLGQETFCAMSFVFNNYFL